jgi:hypothetical protein
MYFIDFIKTPNIKNTYKFTLSYITESLKKLGWLRVKSGSHKRWRYMYIEPKISSPGRHAKFWVSYTKYD